MLKRLALSILYTTILGFVYHFQGHLDYLDIALSGGIGFFLGSLHFYDD